VSGVSRLAGRCGSNLMKPDRLRFMARWHLGVFLSDVITSWPIVLLMFLYGAFLSWGLNHKEQDWTFIWWVWGPGCAFIPFWMALCAKWGREAREAREKKESGDES